MKKKTIAGILCLILGLILGGVGISKYLEERTAGEEYKEIRKAVTEEVPDTPEEKPEPEKESQQPEVEIPIDFESLQQQNPHVYAWIKVPGTAVDYPILQNSEDNSYYLNHTINGEEKPEGAIFTENYNTKTFEDPNTVIYGHDMKNGSMFQSIHKYMDRSFFDENREIIIYLPDKILQYRIFAAYLYDSRHLLLSFDFWDKEEYDQYLHQVRSMRDMNAFVDSDIEVKKEDKIITLSTCYAGMADKRYLVQGVLESIEE